MPKQNRLRRILVVSAAALLAAVAVWWLCRWVGYDLGQSVGNQAQYTIVNDEYSQIIDLPEEGLTQTLPLRAGQTIYGVRFKFSTHSTLYQAGMVMVELRDASGERLDIAAGNFLNIFDDTFTEFVFSNPYTAETDETVTLYLYNEVAWPGPLGLWASEGAVDGMPLCTGSENGTDQNATLAMQVVSDYSGSWPQTLAGQLALPLALAAFAAVLLFGLHAPLWAGVAAVGLALGMAFVQATPALVAPDEYAHLAAAYELASTWSGQTTADENGKLLVRACDAAHFGTKTGEIGIFALKAQEEARRNEAGSPNTLTETSDAAAGQGSGSYLAQALGILLARLQGKNFYTMLRWGRIANLLSYLVLAALAVWLAPPSVRGVFACVCLLPMSLQLAGSLSPDAAVLGTVFCYTALCLRLRGQRAAAWQLALLVVLGCVVAPAKAIYLPLVLLCLIIPPQHLDGPRPFAKTVWGVPVRSGRVVQGALLVLACGLWVAANFSEVAYVTRDANQTLLKVGGCVAVAMLLLLARLYALCYGSARRMRRFKIGLAVLLAAAVVGCVVVFSHMSRKLEPDELLMVNPNGDSIWTFSLGYVCRNLPATVKLLMRSIPEQGALWLQGLLGTTLGEPIVYRIDVSWLLGVGLAVALLAAALPVQGETRPLGRRSAWGSAALVLCVLAAVFAAALNWTPINYQTLFGMQGRYWLPALPLVLTLCKGSRRFAAQRSAAHPAALAVSGLTLLTILQGFGLYASWQA